MLTYYYFVNACFAITNPVYVTESISNTLVHITASSYVTLPVLLIKSNLLSKKSRFQYKEYALSLSHSISLFSYFIPRRRFLQHMDI